MTKRRSVDPKSAEVKISKHLNDIVAGIAESLEEIGGEPMAFVIIIRPCRPGWVTLASNILDEEAVKGMVRTAAENSMKPENEFELHKLAETKQ